MNCHAAPRSRWSWSLRIIALVMALSVFTLPQVLTAQCVADMYAQGDDRPSPILEEEVVKDVCAIPVAALSVDRSDRTLVLLHQYEERMLDHPLREVPHQPPK